MNKEKNIWLDIIQLVLYFVVLIIFTIIFRLEKSQIKYIFVVGDFYVIYSISKVISVLERKTKKRVIKNNNNKIDSKYLRKIKG